MAAPQTTSTSPAYSAEQTRQIAALEQWLQDDDARIIPPPPSKKQVLLPESGLSPGYDPTTKAPKQAETVAASIRTLRDYMIETGQLDEKNRPVPEQDHIYDKSMVNVVKAYQKKLGVEPDGILKPEMREGMLSQFAHEAESNRGYQRDLVNLSLDNLKKTSLPETGMVVDMTRQKLHVLRNGELIADHNVVIGTRSNQTPEGQITGKKGINGVQLQPDWVPTDNIRVGEGAEAIGSGPGSPLGRIRFNTNNPDSIFLHDTNAPKLLNRADGERTFSHGCIRVQHPEKLAKELIREDKLKDNKFLQDRAAAYGLPEITRTDQLLKYASERDKKNPGKWKYNFNNGKGGANLIETENMPVVSLYQPARLEKTASGEEKITFDKDVYGRVRKPNPGLSAEAERDKPTAFERTFDVRLRSLNPFN
jgi:murein L,D-transpeptidase YcbB/YkuD